MSSHTTNLNLYEIDKSNDTFSTFDIDTVLNENWQKIDKNVINKDGTVPFKAEQQGVDPVSPTGLTTMQFVLNLIEKISPFTADTSNMPNIANNSTTSFTQINFSNGFCYDLTTKNKITSTAMVKKLNGAFEMGTDKGGLDYGNIVASSCYHCFAISKSDGTSDFLFSLDPMNPAMPTDFVNKRRIGSIKTDSSGNIIQFFQNGDYFYLKNPMQFVNSTNPGTSAIIVSLPVPSGIQVEAMVNLSVLNGWENLFYVLVTSLNQNDIIPSNSCNDSAMGNGNVNKLVLTNTIG